MQRAMHYINKIFIMIDIDRYLEFIELIKSKIEYFCTDYIWYS